MTEIVFECPECGTRLADEAGGREVVCPNCSARILTPQAAGSPRPGVPCSSRAGGNNVDVGLTVKNRVNGLATASLVLSCLSFLLGPFTCIPGIVCGHIALNQCNRDPALPGRPMAVAGLIIGYIVLAVIVIVLMSVAGSVASVSE